MKALQRTGRALKRGFTLVELLAVIAIISILAIFLLPKIPEAFEAAEVSACKSNMREIHKGLLLYKTKYNRIPEESGAKFFTSLISREVWENTPTSAKKLTCPAVDIGFLEIGGLPEEEWYFNKDTVTGASTSYAGRDKKRFPLRKLTSGTEPLVADDNDGDMNHRTTTNVLFGDGSVQSDDWELAILREQGLLSEDDDILRVGPDSQVEVLRKFSLD